MAEILVKLVLNKLSDVVLPEIFFLLGVKDKVEHLKRVLTRIQCFLKDADRKRSRDEGVRNWVSELRDVSHSIEDTIDLLVLEVEESSGEYPSVEKPSLKEKIKRWFKKPEKGVHMHKFGTKLDKILARIDEIAASREKYGIKNLGEGGGSGVTVSFKRLIIPDLDETELIGVKAEKEKIIAQLLDEKQLKRSVVSIVGPGGLGKSTVASKVYSSNEVKSKFEVRIWLSISQNFTTINLLKKMLIEINGSICDDLQKLMKKVNESLQKKKYLIVLDDVWSDDLWPEIDQALPDVTNGSRVFITSRFSTIPKVADPESEPNELRYLNSEESLKLLLSKALGNRDGIERFSTDISDIAKQLAHICDGLPLALVTSGSLLSTKPVSYHAWENVSKTMVWSVQGKKCMDILTTSYDDMPLELKLCFMYLACYPEDHKIHADELIRLWVAEGLILDTQGIILEDTAEDYLEQLAQRSIVQVLKRSAWGSIEKCALHDLMREIAIQKAKENDFLVVCSNGDVEESCGRARRVAVHHYNCEVMKHTSSNLRSYFCFNNQAQNFSGQRLLRVLHFGFQFIYFKFEFEGIGSLTQLRYLRLDKGVDYNINPLECNRDHEEVQYLPKLIGGQKYLQVLDCSSLHDESRQNDYWGIHVPDCIWKVKTLRHIVLSKCVSGPPPSADLPNLQTLIGVAVPKSWELTALPNLPNLRKLSIEKKSDSSWEVLLAFLHTLKNLEHLKIMSDEFPMEVENMRALPFFHLLKSLQFRAPWRDLSIMTGLDAAKFPAHLTLLSLFNIRINLLDVLLTLEKMQELRILTLKTYDGRSHKIRCTAGGFPQLENLSIHFSEEVLEWEIEEGAMPRLKNLTISRHPSSKSQTIIHGQEHLTALRELQNTRIR